jgi:hypothetical protein
VLNSHHQGEVSSDNRREDIVTLMRPTGIQARDLRETAPNIGPASFVTAQRSE